MPFMSFVHHSSSITTNSAPCSETLRLNTKSVSIPLILYGRTAWDLLARIAIEPAVGRYIQNANLNVNGFVTHSLPSLELIICPKSIDAMVKLLSKSPYLKQANLDWKKYYAAIEEEIATSRSMYSQHAAALLLTLLPNVRTLMLPRNWKPLEVTDKLVDSIVCRALQSHVPNDRPSLSQTTRLATPLSLGKKIRFILGEIFRGFAANSVFQYPDCICIGKGQVGFIYKNLSQGLGANLETIQLTFGYSHSTRWGDNVQDWDACSFIMAIQREVENHLEELSISIWELRGSITPGRVSMYGFRHLRTLRFPLGIASCNVDAAAFRDTLPDEIQIRASRDQELHSWEPFIANLIPASSAHLTVRSLGTNDHEKIIEYMFRHFATKKASQLPALEEVHLSYPLNDKWASYKEKSAKMFVETEKLGLSLCMDGYDMSFPG